MRILGFGTYDGSRQPRVAVLLEGLGGLGARIDELNIPLGFSTAERVAILQRPWLVPRLLLRMSRRWAALSWRRTRLRTAPDVVLVGYLGQFDVLLARVLFPRTVIALDLLVFADDTAKDRGVGSGFRTVLLRGLDRLAIACSTLVIVDTEENLALLPSRARTKAVVAAVGAAEAWFSAPTVEADAGPLRVIFFGMFTPLQGAPVIGAAIASLPQETAIEVTMVGTGQDFAATRAIVGEDARVSWMPWIEPGELPGLVARHDVCLGIFGTSPKALRVVPTKAFQGAAAGCAVLTSGTAPQRRLFGDAALYAPAGDSAGLAAALALLVSDRALVERMRRRAQDLAARSFRPVAVAQPVFDRLRGRTLEEIS